jgi:hypothetical protein
MRWDKFSMNRESHHLSVCRKHRAACRRAEEFAALIKVDIAKWTKVVQDGNIRMD